MPNRHERRKTKVFESKIIPVGKLRGGLCAWEGCQAAFASDDLPEGWTWLNLYRSKRPQPYLLDIPAKDWLRDTTLCPEHTLQLDGQLKDIGRVVSGPSAGSA